MTNNRLQGVLQTLKQQAIATHLLPLFESAPPPAQPSPFELYSYHTPIDYVEVEEKMREEVMRRYNQELYEEEKKRMQMEKYYLQQAVEIEKTEVEMMRIRVEAETSKARLSVPVARTKPEHTVILESPQLEEKEEREEIQKMPATIEKTTKCAIYPNLNIDLTQTIPHSAPQPISKPIPPPLNLQTLPRASTYRRSHTVSQRRTPTPPQPQQTINKKPSLQAIQQQISFYERAWKDASNKSQRKMARHYKAKIAQLLQTFWQYAGQ